MPQKQSIVTSQPRGPKQPVGQKAYLCGMVDLKRSLAFRVEIAVIFERVKFTDDDLSRSIVSDIAQHPRVHPTSSLDPGSFTVESWDSLYRLNAGSREGIMPSPSEVRACTSIERRGSAWVFGRGSRGYGSRAGSGGYG